MVRMVVLLIVLAAIVATCMILYVNHINGEKNVESIASACSVETKSTDQGRKYLEFASSNEGTVTQTERETAECIVSHIPSKTAKAGDAGTMTRGGYDYSWTSVHWTGADAATKVAITIKPETAK